MSFLQLTKTKKKSAPKLKSSTFSSIGKNPRLDWLLLIVLFAILVLAGVTWSVIHFLDVKSSLEATLNKSETNHSAAAKTQEEELQDIIDMYQAKKANHAGLLGRAKIDTAAEKKAATSTATSTAATSTATSSPR